MKDDNKKISPESFKPYLFFSLTGLLFILLAKASINLELFISSFFSIVIVELLFLSLAFLSLKYIFLKYKKPALSYALYYFFTGILGFFLVEFFLNGNKELGILAFIFFFLLKALEASFARVSVDINISKNIKEKLLKNVFASFFLYIFVVLFIFFALSARNIGGISFVVLVVFLSLLFYIFLYRLERPKKKKEEKPLFDDVSFY